MRSRLLPPALLLAIVLGLLTPAPASATIRASISLPHYNFHLFSPFPGPARIRLSWGSGDPDAGLTFRLHRGTTVLHTAAYELQTPGSGSKIVEFTWPAESVNEPTDYRITVHRNSTQLSSRTFTLLPPLVTITSIKPNPFYPLVRDGYRDRTTVRFHLEGSSNPTILTIYRANAQGGCCGIRVRRRNLEDQAVGDRTVEWNGRNGDGTKAARGKYFVRITATKQSFPEDVTRTSRPMSVTIRRG
jgi:hypothetical protein